MIISHSHRFIFFSFPKTGSESVRDLLKPYSEENVTIFPKRSRRNPFYSHISPIETRKLFLKKNWDFNSYRKFVFVRNPWDRLLSLFKMINRIAGDDYLNILNYDNKVRFEAWIMSVDNKGSGGGGRDSDRWRKYGTYSILNYAAENNGELLVDAVLRLEDIRQALPEYLNALGMPRRFTDEDIPAINVAPLTAQLTGDWYSSASSKRVEELYGYEIARFGYSQP